MALTYEPFDTVTVSKLNEKLGGGIEAINGEISALEAKIPKIFLATTTYTAPTPEQRTYTIDKTYEECLAAYRNGYWLLLNTPDGAYLPLQRVLVGNSGGQIVWSGFNVCDAAFVTYENRYQIATLDNENNFTYDRNTLVEGVNPTYPNQMANKKYVDTSISTLQSKIPTNAATQDYVNTTVANYLPLSGGTLTGNLTISKDFNSGIVFSDGDGINNIQNTARGLTITSTTGLLSLYGRNGSNTCRIENVTTPTSGTDAANKKYVDDKIGLERVYLGKVSFSVSQGNMTQKTLSLSSSYSRNKLVSFYATNSSGTNIAIDVIPMIDNTYTTFNKVWIRIYNVDGGLVGGDAYIYLMQEK